MKKTLIILSSIAALGGIYVFLQRRNKIPFSPVKHKLEKISQGRYRGKDEPKKVALYISKRRYEKNIAPSKDGIFRTSDYVIVSGTDEFDGTYKLQAKWSDKNNKIAAIWIDVDKKISGTEFSKGKFAVISKDNFLVG